MLSATKERVGGAEASPFSKIATYINIVKGKIKAGDYPTEEVRCFCGADYNDHVITSFDRYSIPHRMVMCKECGLMRATPRMTQQAYSSFYNLEYRNIYDTWEFQKIALDRDELFLKDKEMGMRFYDFIQYFDIPIETVFDIGCNMGAWLLPFKEHGSDVYGVDLGLSNIEYGKSMGLNLINGGVDSLVKLGKKADLIILNHVFEHFLDIEGEIANIKKLLKPNGMLYIGVPGFFGSNPNLLFQNAHTYQYTADTLGYVMNCIGFDEYYLDETISSLWVMHSKSRDKKDKPVQAIQDISNYMQGKKIVPKVRTINKFTMKERKENIKKILSYKYPDITKFVQNVKHDAVIIGGGPSVNGYIEKIKERQKTGAKVFCIERMYPWCHENGITPDFVCVLDASDDVPDGFSYINPNTIHLVATQSNAKVMDLLKGHHVYIFATLQKGINQADMFIENGYKRVCVVNGGGSVTLSAMALAYTFGCRKLHIFGFDCHVTEGEYANGIAGVGCIRDCYEVKIDGRTFKTNNAFLSFLQQFFVLVTMADAQGLVEDVKIYGDSMVKFASKTDIDGDKV